MNEFARPKPLCLIIISGLHPDYLFNNELTFFRDLASNYPFLILSSAKKNVDNYYDSYLELACGATTNQKHKIALGKVIANAGLTQLHLADTESYSYITYFFNNKSKVRNAKEVWLKSNTVQSDFYLNNVNETYKQLSRILLKEINKQYYDFIVVNYNDLLVNSDQLRTLNALVKNIKNIITNALSFGGAVLITSNSSLVKNDNRVPLFLISKEWKNKSFIDYDYQREINKQDVSGDIIQIAPTILKILKISKPREMETTSLI